MRARRSTTRVRTAPADRSSRRARVSPGNERCAPPVRREWIHICARLVLGWRARGHERPGADVQRRHRSDDLAAPAALDLIPNDTVLPCQELAEDYNAALGIGLGDGGASVSAAITSLADAGYNARVTGAVQSTNPLLPPSPIRSFQRFPEPDDRTCGDARVPAGAGSGSRRASQCDRSRAVISEPPARWVGGHSEVQQGQV